MAGPQVRCRVRGQVYSAGIVDLLVLAVFAWLTIGQHSDVRPGDLTTAVLSVFVVVVAIGSAIIAERLRLELASPVAPVSPITISMLGAMTLTRADLERGRRMLATGSRGALIDLAVLGGGAFLAGLSYRHSGLPAATGLAAGAAVAGMALLRFMPILGTNGGRLLRWYLQIILEDDDEERRMLSFATVLTGALVAATGFPMLLGPTAWNWWGLPVAIAGIDAVIAGYWFSRRERWAVAASKTALESIGHSRLPVISHSAPISELLSIFAVEGERAIVVVVDARGRPTGSIQLRHLRMAIRTRSEIHPDQVMITIDQLPHVERTTTVLDAALHLERTGHLAAVFTGSNGSPRVVSLDELRTVVD
jgi:hypothetical protein